MTEPRDLLDTYAAALPPIRGAAEYGETVADTVPELVAALRAVLALHEPEQFGPPRDSSAQDISGPDDTPAHICRDCSADRLIVAYPCDTVQAIITALQAA